MAAADGAGGRRQCCASAGAERRLSSVPEMRAAAAAADRSVDRVDEREVAVRGSEAEWAEWLSGGATSTVRRGVVALAATRGQ